MPRAQIARLVFAFGVVLAIVITLGVTVNPTATPPPGPITRQIMRRKDRSKQPPSATEIAELKRKAHGQEKKNIRIKEFKDMPLKVQAIRNLDSESWHSDLQIEVKNVGTKPIYSILAYLEFLDEKDKVPGNGRKAQDKEKRDLKIRDFRGMPLKIHAIRNVDSDTWYKDLQIEVKNTGDKPIYFLLAYLEFPDHKPGGRETGLALTFGELKYVDISILADAADRHLDPGETYAFTIPEKLQKSLGGQHERSPEEFRKLDFHVSVLSFGDRTGFEASGDPVNLKTKQPNSAGYKKHHGEKRSLAAVRSPPQDGCGSCSRLRIGFEFTCFNVPMNEWCAPAPLTIVDSSKPCRLSRTTYYDCDDDPDHFPECPQDEIYNSPICPGYDPSANPSPTPSPSPSPTCNPATKPNDVNCFCAPPILPGGDPQWSCSCTYPDSLGLPTHGIAANHPVNGGSRGVGGAPGFQ